MVILKSTEKKMKIEGYKSAAKGFTDKIEKLNHDAELRYKELQNIIEKKEKCIQKIQRAILKSEEDLCLEDVQGRLNELKTIKNIFEKDIAIDKKVQLVKYDTPEEIIDTFGIEGLINKSKINC